MGDLYNPFPKLPKNIRQIGDTDQVVRLYLEDYVNTYLKRLYPTGKQTMRVGVLLGNVEQYDGTPYIFVDGAMELEDVETDGEKILFSDNTWKKAYQAIEEAFPKRTIQGWFLCGGPGCQLSPLNYWKQHGQYFAGKNQLMYLNHGLEGDEAIYITSEDGFYRLKGHCVYYERNQMMQDYMITRKDVRRIETGSHEQVIKDFRKRMVAKKELVNIQSSKVSALGMLCGILSVALLAGGVALFNNYSNMQRMESVLASVLPVGVTDWDQYGKEQAAEPDFIIEELPGNVYPTEAPSETAERYTAGSQNVEAETMTSEAQVSQTEAAGETGTKDGADMKGGSDVKDGSGAAKESEAISGSHWAEDVSFGGSVPEENGQTSSSLPQGDEGGEFGEIEEASPLEPSVRPEIVGMDKDPSSRKEGEGDAQNDLKDHPSIDYEAAAANGYRIHQVGDGETLYGLCWKIYGDLSRLSEICRLNYLEDENRIFAGQKLILP